MYIIYICVCVCVCLRARARTVPFIYVYAYIMCIYACTHACVCQWHSSVSFSSETERAKFFLKLNFKNLILANHIIEMVRIADSRNTYAT